MQKSREIPNRFDLPTVLPFFPFKTCASLRITLAARGVLAIVLCLLSYLFVTIRRTEELGRTRSYVYRHTGTWTLANHPVEQGENETTMDDW